MGASVSSDIDVAEISGKLGIDTEPLERYRKANMYVGDPSCCGSSCGC